MGISRHLANIRELAAITLVTATMTACSTGGGNPLDTLTGDYKYAPDYIKANIIARKSTKEQVRQAFGAPYSAQDNVSDNSSEWYYDRNESGLNSLTKMAVKYSNRYGSGDAASTLLQGQSRMGDAQEMIGDASTLSGTQATGRKASITRIFIKFKGNVVERFTTD
ncbi:Uncharacterized protein ALO70_00496 [Pseudomonas amygdali pv. eriobotryae]|uniref:Lipoprotein n=3 Tax=Pseudomonas syringae group TaxID=136849 RepID=A0A0P9QZ18_PSEA0|nr:MULTISPECIES: hypothetical protein [Pseudomonas syringae group]KPX04062.1 Uncharacterized protein ALO73_03122 [Pseudomonas syringae pv. daphniphylli]KPX37882.1 Uncharacterized protein ALO70_00496 [Pseudomonas amygdali pv. eriobotryae]KWS80575.1 hypothetical protein AL052_24040 [Pseudomonas amygdali pv. eriobotryae]KWS90810.1 hypothetical protein AL050_19015 [Pseudomonas syringae pv. daphniphylli]RMM00302.1 hypothetical protein ALQ86_04581 [Pseudomonas amygdali pv. eriobotryae]